MWPVIPVHGDFNFNNVLLSSEGNFIIDWENAIETIFIYDLINMIFVEGMYSNDYSYLDMYLKGTYDEYFNGLFQSFGKHYVSTDRLYYLAMYLAVRISEFEMKVNKENIDSIYKRYILT